MQPVACEVQTAQI